MSRGEIDTSLPCSIKGCRKKLHSSGEGYFCMSHAQFIIAPVRAAVMAKKAIVEQSNAQLIHKLTAAENKAQRASAETKRARRQRDKLIDKVQLLSKIHKEAIDVITDEIPFTGEEND